MNSRRGFGPAATPFARIEKMTEELQEVKRRGLVQARVLRDVWGEDGERTRAGSIIDVTKDALIEGLENGTLERVR